MIFSGFTGNNENDAVRNKPRRSKTFHHFRGTWQGGNTKREFPKAETLSRLSVKPYAKPKTPIVGISPVISLIIAYLAISCCRYHYIVFCNFFQVFWRVFHRFFIIDVSILPFKPRKPNYCRKLYFVRSIPTNVKTARKPSKNIRIGSGSCAFSLRFRANGRIIPVYD